MGQSRLRAVTRKTKNVDLNYLWSMKIEQEIKKKKNNKKEIAESSYLLYLSVNIYHIYLAYTVKRKLFTGYKLLYYTLLDHNTEGLFLSQFY